MRIAGDKTAIYRPIPRPSLHRRVLYDAKIRPNRILFLPFVRVVLPPVASSMPPLSHCIVEQRRSSMLLSKTFLFTEILHTIHDAARRPGLPCGHATCSCSATFLRDPFTLTSVMPHPQEQLIQGSAAKLLELHLLRALTTTLTTLGGTSCSTYALSLPRQPFCLRYRVR